MALDAEDIEAAGQLVRGALDASIGPFVFFGLHGVLWGGGWLAGRGRAWLQVRLRGAAVRIAEQVSPARWRSFLERWGGWRAVAISALVVLDSFIVPELPLPHLDPFEKLPVRPSVEGAWIEGVDLWVALFVHLVSLVLGAVFGLIVSWRATLWAVGQFVAIVLAVFWGWARTMVLDGCRGQFKMPCGLVENVMALMGLWP